MDDLYIPYVRLHVRDSKVISICTLQMWEEDVVNTHIYEP
jgi:hypothetical protein